MYLNIKINRCTFGVVYIKELSKIVIPVCF